MVMKFDHLSYHLKIKTKKNLWSHDQDSINTWFLKAGPNGDHENHNSRENESENGQVERMSPVDGRRFDEWKEEENGGGGAIV